jgi:hypothetical protein
MGIKFIRGLWEVKILLIRAELAQPVVPDWSGHSRELSRGTKSGATRSIAVQEIKSFVVDRLAAIGCATEQLAGPPKFLTALLRPEILPSLKNFCLWT